MAQSVVDRWPAEAMPLTVYAEGFEPDVDGVVTKRLPAWLDAFKAEHGGDPRKNGMTAGGYHYIFDAVRFAHKIAAVTDFGADLDDGIMIWLDADIYTHSDVTWEWLKALLPHPAYLGWLDRKNTHPECGFVMYRCSHRSHGKMMQRMRDVYVSGDLFKMPRWDDCHMLQALVAKAQWSHEMPAPQSLSGRAVRTSHPLVCGPLSQCFDHLKGDRKGKGRTPASERSWFVNDGHPYWAADGIEGKRLRAL